MLSKKANTKDDTFINMPNALLNKENFNTYASHVSWPLTSDMHKICHDIFNVSNNAHVNSMKTQNIHTKCWLQCPHKQGRNVCFQY